MRQVERLQPDQMRERALREDYDGVIPREVPFDLFHLLQVLSRNAVIDRYDSKATCIASQRKISFQFGFGDKDTV